MQKNRTAKKGQNTTWKDTGSDIDHFCDDINRMKKQLPDHRLHNMDSAFGFQHRKAGLFTDAYVPHAPRITYLLLEIFTFDTSVVLDTTSEMGGRVPVHPCPFVDRAYESRRCRD